MMRIIVRQTDVLFHFERNLHPYAGHANHGQTHRGAIRALGLAHAIERKLAIFSGR